MTMPLRKLSYRSPKTEVRASPIHGLGLFARETIHEGEVVAVKGGYILTGSEVNELPRELADAELQVGDDLFIAPGTIAERDGSMLYTNHACEPNIAIEGQIVFIALRDIEAGEELTHDWATTDDGDYRLPCRCGSRACRGTITGKDWMKPELQDRYRGHFSAYLQRKIEARRSQTR